MVGLVVSIDWKKHNEYSFTDILIADNFQGRGYAMEAVKRIVEKFKKENKYNEISPFVHNTNDIEIHIYEKSGLKHSGRASWDENFLVMSMEI